MKLTPGGHLGAKNWGEREYHFRQFWGTQRGGGLKTLIFLLICANTKKQLQKIRKLIKILSIFSQNVPKNCSFGGSISYRGWLTIKENFRGREIAFKAPPPTPPSPWAHNWTQWGHTIFKTYSVLKSGILTCSTWLWMFDFRLKPIFDTAALGYYFLQKWSKYLKTIVSIRSF